MLYIYAIKNIANILKMIIISAKALFVFTKYFLDFLGKLLFLFIPDIRNRQHSEW